MYYDTFDWDAAEEAILRAEAISKKDEDTDSFDWDAAEAAILAAENAAFSEPEEQDSAWGRGMHEMKSSVAKSAMLANNDARGIARLIQEDNEYRRLNPGSVEAQENAAAWQRGSESGGVKGGLSAVKDEVVSDWNEADSITGKVGSAWRNVKALGESIVSQTPNMILPTVGSLAGGAAGSAAGSEVPVVGTAVGGVLGMFAGGGAGNALVEGGGIILEDLQKSGVNITDEDAVAKYISENRGDLLAKTGIKGSVLGLVDMLTLRAGHLLLNKPIQAATERALVDLGVDVTKKTAVEAAKKDLKTEIGKRLAADSQLLKETTGVQKWGRNIAAAALEPAGEYVGEGSGGYAITGEWNNPEAFLEAVMSLGTSTATFAGQKAYQYGKGGLQRAADGIRGGQPVQPAPTTQTPGVEAYTPQNDADLQRFGASLDSKIAAAEQQIRGGGLGNNQAAPTVPEILPAMGAAPVQDRFEMAAGQVAANTRPDERNFTANDDGSLTPQSAEDALEQLRQQRSEIVAGDDGSIVGGGQPVAPVSVSLQDDNIPVNIDPRTREILDAHAGDILRSKASPETIKTVNTSLRNIATADSARIAEIEATFDERLKSMPEFEPFRDVLSRAVQKRKADLAGDGKNAAGPATPASSNTTPNPTLDTSALDAREIYSDLVDGTIENQAMLDSRDRGIAFDRMKQKALRGTSPAVTGPEIVQPPKQPATEYERGQGFGIAAPVVPAEKQSTDDFLSRQQAPGKMIAPVVPADKESTADFLIKSKAFGKAVATKEMQADVASKEQIQAPVYDEKDNDSRFFGSEVTAFKGKKKEYRGKVNRILKSSTGETVYEITPDGTDTTFRLGADDLTFDKIVDNNPESNSEATADNDKTAGESSGKPAALTITPHNDKLLITGKTLANKDRIKALGAKWSSQQKGWIIPASKEADVRVELADLLGGEVKADEENARREDTDGFTDGMSPMVKGKVLKTLNTSITANGKLKTKKQWIKDIINSGGSVSVKEQENEAAKKKDRELISRVQKNYLLTPNDRSIGSNKNIPAVKEAYEAIDRLENNDYPPILEYHINNADGGFYTVTKTEHDYAKHLLTRQQPAKQDPPTPLPEAHHGTPPGVDLPGGAVKPKIKEEKPQSYGSKNKIFTADAAAKAREILKDKLKQMNTGLDPEMMQAGMILAGYHIEAGARAFTDYAKAMMEDLGAGIKPYLRSFYESVRHYPGMDNQGMSNADEIDEAISNLDKASLTQDNKIGEDQLYSNSTKEDDNVLSSNVTDADEESVSGTLEGVEAEGVRGDTGSERDEHGNGQGGDESPQANDSADAARTTRPRSRKNRSGKVHSQKTRTGNAEGVGGVDEVADAQLEDAPSLIPAVNYTITDDVNLGSGGETVKFNDNIAAIKTLKAIEREQRRATPSEQKILARYVGWGGLKNAFAVADEDGRVAKGWEDRVKQVEDLLTSDELKAARNSTTAAHYTSKTVVKAIWSGVQRLGFQGGMVLEPSMGSGNFLGLMPEGYRGSSQVLGVEYDSITARIARALYPQSTVLHSGFEKVPLPEGAFDLVIGNPPFGNRPLFFKHSPDINGISIHNQFFLASMAALKPGGIQAMVVSRYFMDARDATVRTKMARMADLVGAIRLPDTAFKENARTKVITDILFFQKRESERPQGDIPGWIDTIEVADPAGGEAMVINKYFADNPSVVIGTMDRTGSMQHSADITVHLDDPASFERLLAEQINKLPKGIVVPKQQGDSSINAFNDMVDSLQISMNGEEDGSLVLNPDGSVSQVYSRELAGGSSGLARRTLMPGDPWSPNLEMGADGKWFREVDKIGPDGQKVKVAGTRNNEKVREVFDDATKLHPSMRINDKKLERLKEALGILDSLKKQINLEIGDSSAKEIESNRAVLRGKYDAYVKKHGYLNDKATVDLISDMPDGALLMALEFKYKKPITKQAAEKAGISPRDAQAQMSAILEKRVIYPYENPSSADSPADALAITMSESGVVDLDRIAELLGTDEDGVIKQLFTDMEKPLIFLDPETKQWTPADEYLSGNVARKLEAAMRMSDPKNVDALRAVQPEPWGAENVSVLIGATWVPPKVYSDFLKHLTGGSAEVTFSKATNAFGVYGQVNKKEWSTDDWPTYKLVSALLNSTTIKVSWKDYEGKTHVDHEATELALSKAEEIKEEFKSWIFSNADRMDMLVDLFNKKFNTRVTRQRDGSHLKFPGKVPDAVIQLRRHQKNAVWRGITDRFVLYDHAVGAGKTFTAIARAMERRRMGLSRKPMIVVPNHMIEQFAADTYRLYPGAKVLAATKKDLEKKRRRRFFAKIATGDWDIVIMPHSSFGFIDISPETESRYLEEELQIAIQAVVEAQEEAEEGGPTGFRKPFTVAAAEALRDRIQARLDKLRNGGRNADRLLTFEQMGVDDLTIDEAHEFKNLFYSSNLNARGMNPKEGSNKAYSLWNKVRVLRESKRGSIAFMTGTPISNSAVEMYILQRYLGWEALADAGLDHFDAWRNQFASVTTAFEPTESGRGLKEVNRIGRYWSNMRSLMEMYYEFADTVSNDDIKRWFAEDNPGKEFPLPKVAGGQRKLINVPPTAAQSAILEEVVAGFEGLPNIKDIKQRAGARLRLMNLARELSLDAREVDPFTDSEEYGGKLDVASDEIFRLYNKWDKDKGTQLVFLDRSIPKASTKEKNRLLQYDKHRKKMEQAEVTGDTDALLAALEALEGYDANEMEAVRRSLRGGWNAYQQIKDNLIAKGVPPGEIRFIHEANTDAQKQSLFDQVNTGEVRVLIGSTPRMGAGTNVQERLVALHHIDVTWKPSDIEQREGRIIRQGNELYDKYGGDNFEVEILAYTTETTIDAKLWSLNATKLGMINGIRKYDGQFEMEFDDADTLSMAEIAAVASGNPLQMERVELDAEIKKLQRLKNAYLRQLRGDESKLNRLRKVVQYNPGIIADGKRAVEVVARGAKLAENLTKKRSVNINGEVFDWEHAGDAHATLSAIAIAANDTKSKFSVTINGDEFGNREKAFEAVADALGDGVVFHAELDGKPFNRQLALARVIAERANAATAAKPGRNVIDESIARFQYLGVDVSVSMDYRHEGQTATYQVEGTIERPDGSRQMVFDLDLDIQASGGKQKTASAKSLIDRIFIALSERRLKEELSSRERDLEIATRDIPDLEQSVKKSFGKEEELADKMRRFAEVERILAASADNNRAGGQQAAPSDDDAMLSIAPAPSPTGNTVADLKKELRAGLKFGFSRLMASKRLQVVQSADALPEHVGGMLKSVKDSITILYSKSGGIAGAYDPKTKTTYLVADNIKPGEAMSVLAHELGVHARHLGFREDAEFQAVLHALKRRSEEQGATGEAIRKAMAAVPKDTTDAHYWEEVASYLVQQNYNAPNVGLVRRLLAVVKKWLVKAGLSANIFNEKDLVAFAKAAMVDEAKAAADEGREGREIEKDIEDEINRIEANQKRLTEATVKDSLTVGDDQAAEEAAIDALDNISNIALKSSRTGPVPGRKLSEKDIESWAIDHAADTPSAVRTTLERAGFYDDYARGREDMRRGADTNDPLGSGVHKLPEQEARANLQHWRKASQLIDESGRDMVFFQGSDTFGIPGDDSTWVFSDAMLGSNVPHPRTALGHTFTMLPGQAKAFAKKTGRVFSYYLRAEKPFILHASNAEFASRAAARSLYYKLKYLGYDSIYIPEWQYIYIFDSNQAKWVKNSGEYSQTNPDVRYSIQQQMDESTATVSEALRKKADIRAISQIISTPLYNFKKDPATRRMLEAAMRRGDLKTEMEGEILDGLTGEETAEEFQAKNQEYTRWMTALQKNDKADYESGREYLLEVDKTGKAFRIKTNTGYLVSTPSGVSLGIAKTKEEAHGMVQKHHAQFYGKGSAVFMKDYPISEKDSTEWTVLDPAGAEVSTHDNAADADEAALQAEAKAMRKKGHSEKSIEMVGRFRKVMNRAFDKMIADYKEVVREAKENDLDPPAVEVVDESKRYVIIGPDGNKIKDAYYETEEQAHSHLKSLIKSHPKFANARVKRQKDSEIVKEITLNDAISMMGDLRGSYFPRQRQRGGVVLIAVNKTTGEKIRENFDLYITKGVKINPDTGEELPPNKLVELLREGFNKYTPIARRARKLQMEGFTITIDRDNSMPESVFEAAHLTTAIAAMLDAGKQSIDKRDAALSNAYSQLNKVLTASVADIVKARGFLSSRLRRSPDYWQGFETDPLTASVQYAKGLAAGMAKRKTAQEITMAITGRDIPWSKFHELYPDATFEDYQKFVEGRKLDPKEQPNLFREAMSYTKEMLRNEEQFDRIVGTVRGLAVLHFLGFRVSSAAVNMTNLAMAVPATISSNGGKSLSGALLQVSRSLRALYRHNRGQGSAGDERIFKDIKKHGWDKAQFNHENAAALRSKMGNHWAKFLDASMYLFGKAEEVNRAVAIHAAYKELNRALSGLSHEELMLKAKEISDKAHGVYGKENSPAWTRGPLGNIMKMGYTFKTFSHNYALNMGEMVGRGDYKDAAWMLLAPGILAGAGASAVTPVIMAVAAALGLGGGDDPEEELYAWAERTFGTDRPLRAGIVGLFGVDMSSSLEMALPLPTSMEDFWGAPGAMLTDAAKGVGHLRRGEISKGVEKLAPVGVGNLAKARREFSEGVTTESYSRRWNGADPMKVSAGDSLLRAASFNPAQSAEVRAEQWSKKRIAYKYQQQRDEINRAIKRAIVQYNGQVPPDQWAKISERIEDYNGKVSRLGRADISMITRASIKNLIRRQRRPSRRDLALAVEE